MSSPPPTRDQSSDYEVMTDAELRDVLVEQIATCIDALPRPPESTPAGAAAARALAIALLLQERAGEAIPS